MTIRSISTLIGSRISENFSKNKEEILFKALVTTVCIIALSILASLAAALTGIAIGMLSALAVFCTASVITHLLQDNRSFIQRAVTGVKMHIQTHSYFYSAIACLFVACEAKIIYEKTGASHFLGSRIIYKKFL